MGLAHSPSIVTNGLVLCLDAANRKSYPGSGTAWTDLSGNNNTGTLTNGPTFSGTNRGAIVFDGVDDYVDFFAPNLGSIATVELWCKIGSVSGKLLFGWYQYSVYCNNSLGFNTANGDVYGISSATITSLGLLNNWKHYIFEMRTDVSYTNNKIYINASPQTLTQQSGTEVDASRSFNSGNGKIALWNFVNYSFNMPMDCSNFKVYNRALSANEVLQNYNALKGRFGL